MAMTMNLHKEGDAAPAKLTMNLKKSEGFRVRLSWDGDHDLDLHAILGINTGQGSKASAFEDVLSPYNIRRKIKGEEVGILDLKADRTFEIHGGALVHSPDATNGSAEGDDEFIQFNPQFVKLPSIGVVEIPLIAMIHPQSSGITFKDVLNPRVFIEDTDKKIVFEASLSAQFGQFVGVQMGSIVLERDGSISFVPLAVGFNEDWNQVLAYFS